MPEGTTKNYYPTRQSLLEAAAARMAEQHRAAVTRLRETTPASATPSQVRMLYSALIQRAVEEDRTQVLAMVELYLEAVRHPAVRTALGEMVAANAHAAAALHQSAGLLSSPSDTGLLDACILGVMVTQLALPPEALRAIGLDDTDAIGAQLFDATTVYPGIRSPHSAALH